MLQSKRSQRHIRIIDIIIFSLVVLSELPKIYAVSRAEWLLAFINYIQVPLYVGMIIIIINNKYPIKQFILAVFVESILLIGYFKSGQATFFRGVLLLLAIRDVPFKRITRICRTAISSVAVLSLFLYMLGISDAGLQRRSYVAFGYLHPNVVAQVITIISLLWMAEKEEKLNIKDYCFTELVGLLVYIFTGSRTATIILVSSPVIIIFVKKMMKTEKMNSILCVLVEASQWMFFVLTWFFAKTLPNSHYLKMLDLIFVNRLFLNYYLFDNHPVTVFGQNIELKASNVYNNIQNVWNVSVTCDSTYAMSLLIMGLIPTIIFAIGYVMLMHKALREKNYVVVAIALTLALYGFFEAQLLEIYNNFVYFYITAYYVTNRKIKEESLSSV